MRNTLYYGDNLTILHDHIASESVDLIYLDPPFNSSRTYNVLFKHESGQASEAQVRAFDDTWHWGMEAEATFHELVTHGTAPVGNMIGAMRQFVGENQMMAYLVMMAARLLELHRVLKPTGSLYLHCDPTASHYLKVLLDTVFGGKHFRNEIIWCYRKWSVAQKQFVSNHDVILFYTKSEENTFNVSYVPLSDGTLKRWKGKKQQATYDKDGKRLAANLDEESSGSPMPDWWEISILNPNAAERLGYPTQKPVALLERIISASSNPGDVVLDPFCGCGTTIDAAQKLGRTWIGIDITHLAISLQKYRLKDTHDLVAGRDYTVIGEPADLAGAAQLAQDDRHQFEWWALSLIQAQPISPTDSGGKKGKKGADRGIDGQIVFIDDSSGKPKRILVQVKSGHVSSSIIRDLRGVVEREGAAMGVLITLDRPSLPMITEAVSAGYYQSPGWNRTYPKLQILTVEGLLAGVDRLERPPTAVTFKQAAKAESSGQQGGLFDGG